MPTVAGALRRLALTPSLASVTFERRGFPPAAPAVARWLEAIPHAVVCGFEWGIDVRDEWELERRLELVEPGMRGFAYEGATMACTVLDAISPGRRRRTRELLLGPGAPHIFLAYIGIGFAMNHLPRPLWRKVLPDLSGNPYHPTMSWLAVDGYGFDLAYFDVRRYVERQAMPGPYPWQGRSDYFPRAVDQGIGRALWFIQAARVADVDAAVRRFAADRQADLWSGVGLAATFAGGCAAEDLSALRRLAGPYASQLALGSVFAAKARSHAGFVPSHSAAAVAALTDLTVPAAAALADDTEPVPVDTGTAPAYEVWRGNIRRHFAAVPQPSGD